jgi:Mn2+/Fe2+ NRAMP family transporter
VKALFKSVGPALIVAAVVLGPGSILTSSKVGATFGIVGLPVIIGSAILMIAMVALSARLGVVYENSLCDELASRLGRPVAILIGLILFTLVALFQSSNNIALIGGIESMLMDGALSSSARIILLILFNLMILGVLYLLRDLYQFVEKMMKLLIGFMCLAFLINFLLVLFNPPEFEIVPSRQAPDLIPLLAMIGTTFSVAGAFYQAYLVKEKGWSITDARKGLLDSIISISALGIITAVILLTAWLTFYGRAEAVVLLSVGDVARQLEPLFGSGAKIIFAAGILAGALSSFLVNALIGGTIMSDALGKGSKLSDRWTIHLTAVALLVGLIVAIASLTREGSTVLLITFAQALTVLGIPALAAALIYLGTRKELTGKRKVPRPILFLAMVGFCVSLVLAGLTANKVYGKMKPAESRVAQAS